LLVTCRDGRAAPKVIDFGIARLLVPHAGDRRRRTLPGQVLGTPAYMSPEQIRDPSGPLDVRTDVYSLGVVLHELLVGTLPAPHRPGRHRTRSADGGGPLSIFAPAPPSKHVRAGVPGVRRVAAERGLEPRALARRLKGRLDRIVLKALEVDPARRYGAVAELATDLRRFLDDHPLGATPKGILRRITDLMHHEL
ncbi:MAG: protein kinase domain-containing protein, partial [Planctomycetota bacterium]